MKKNFVRNALLATTAVCALTLGLNYGPAVSVSSFSTAHAEEDGGHSGSTGDHSDKGHKGGENGKGQGGAGTTGHGTNAGKGIKDKVFEEGEGPDGTHGPGYMGGKETTGQSGTKKGDLFGDMVLILRDENGVPILKDGYVQPIDKDGNPIELNSEGEPVDPSKVVEVELGRLNVGRSPSKVLANALGDAVDQINAADSVSLDASGRLVTTTDGVAKTIDSPLANLALYTALVTSGSIPGVDPSKLGSLSYLADGTITTKDLDAAASMLAAAGDKTGSFNVDTVEYLNAIAGIEGTVTGPDGKTYVDYSSFTYDRSDVYGAATAQVLIETSPGVYTSTTVNLYEAVFGSTDATGSNADGFAQAVDDARAVLLYVHDHSAPE